MNFFERLFSGDPDAKARRAEAKARREAEDAAEADTRAHALLLTAQGEDREARSYQARSKAAISLVLSCRYDQGLLAWESIAQDFPDHADSALQQVGACHHLKKDYAAAINAYHRAIDAGLDPAFVDDSIESARVALAGG